MNTAAYIITNTGTISLTLDGEVYQIAQDHMNYKRILDELKAKNYDLLPRLMDVGKGIIAAATDAGSGDVTIQNGMIYYKGFIVDTSLTRRILELINGNFPFEPMLKFFENLMLNPSARALQELYNFLDVNKIPITDDGCFLAYKRVNSNYYDFYTGTMDNSIGKEVVMDRKDVNDDSTQTCSHGLHVCSLAYLPHYHSGDGRIVIVKINPRDVVSIPADYNDSKMRVCRYLVVAEVPTEDREKEVFNEPVYDLSDDSEFEDTADTTPYWNKRDKSGKFMPKLGRKPDGTAYWNKRDASGKFASKR